MAFWDQDYSEQTIIDIILLVVIFDVFWKEITFNNTIMESCRLVKIYIPSSHNYSAKTFNPFWAIWMSIGEDEQQSVFSPYNSDLDGFLNSQFVI